MTDIATVACQNIDANQPVVIATIIAHHGSTPRESGSKMLVAVSDQIHGTIGGGVVEFNVIQIARKSLSQGLGSRLLHVDISDRDAAAQGMVCGGNVTVLIDVIHPADTDPDVFHAWRQAIKSGQPCKLVTSAKKAMGRLQDVRHGVVRNDGAVIGNLSWNAIPRQHEAFQVIESETSLLVIEPIRQKPWLYLFGAGHVAQHTAHLAQYVGFRACVIDDRPEFANPERFPEISDIRVITDFKTACHGLPVDERSFVVIVTRGHQHDKTVLRQVLDTPAGYVGMIGSLRKRDAVYQRLVDEDVPPQQLERVHCPIGVAIAAQTPEEIAVSIVAELIQVKAGM